MATNEIGEKIYYSDESSKVTNVRVTCANITVLVGKIGRVELNFRTEEFALGIIVFFSSAIPFMFLGFVPESVKMIFAVGALSLMVSSALWIIMIYRNYVELFVTVNDRKVAILSTNMMKKDYLSKIASAIGEAIADEERYRKLKDSGKFDVSAPVLDLSETMELKMMLEDYQKLKEIKNRIVIEPKAAASI